ncbi:hypothetical protein FHR84_003151 [Actinopolyspora biskrensis]|uniref:Uncharacterized protein n=1 Tax=Actinopolyspora biskrensis TaxID=1470178 RepID=A0A852ZCS6_9ACTN|nr:hypothetical protein [Actinopolyspora biskrensis]NYH79813.1 hypothetical protein [Actinopolyspora biskrensis]
MTPDQDFKLHKIKYHFTGSPKTGEFPGHESWVDGSEAHFTVVDFSRHNHLKAVHARNRAARRKAQLDQLAEAVARRHQLDVDELKAAVAEAVADGIDEATAQLSVTVRGQVLGG